MIRKECKEYFLSVILLYMKAFLNLFDIAEYSKRLPLKHVKNLYFMTIKE